MTPSFTKSAPSSHISFLPFVYMSPLHLPTLFSTSAPILASPLPAHSTLYKRMSHITITRSSSPIRKPSRTSYFSSSITRAATCPALPQSSFPISPNSCFTDDTALEQLLANSLPSRPSSPSPSYPIPISPVHSDLTQFPFLLPKPLHSLNPYHSMTNPSDSSSRNNRTSRNPSNSANNNSTNNRTTTDHNSSSQPRSSRTNNRRRRSSTGASNAHSNSRRRSNNPPDESLRCDVCHQYYSRRDNLRVHQRVHTGSRPYQCRFCAQRFRWLGALRNHEANHIRDGDRPLNPPPPGARQPTTASPRSSRSSAPASSSNSNSNSQSGRNQHPSSSRQNTATRSTHRQPTSPRAQPTQQTQQTQPPTSSHRAQRSSAAQRNSPTQPRRSHPLVPNLEFNIDPHGNPSRHVLVTEDDPQISPLYDGPHDNWGILDDLTDDRSRD